MAIDNPEAAMAAVKRIRARFPALQVIARAHGRTDAYEYAEIGVPAIREVFGSAIDASFETLKTLGYEEETARRIVQRFKEYDERQVGEQARHRGDLSKLIALTEQGRRDIAQLLAAEAQSAPKVD
jgi:glutathione-regulated potassium-efflux system protein KefB